MIKLIIVSILSFLSFGATYTLTGWDVTAVWTSATDVANSLFGMIGDLLPVLVPVLVIGFAIGIVLSMIKRR